MRRRVKRTFAWIGAAAVVAGGAGVGAARAASPEQHGAGAGGTYSKSRSTPTCSLAVGKSDTTIARGGAPDRPGPPKAPVPEE